MKEYLEVFNKQLDELVVMVRSDLTNIDHKKFSTILVIDVHARDIIEIFVRDRLVANS
jgi:dynein heavy chain